MATATYDYFYLLKYDPKSEVYQVASQDITKSESVRITERKKGEDKIFTVDEDVRISLPKLNDDDDLPFDLDDKSKLEYVGFFPSSGAIVLEIDDKFFLASNTEFKKDTVLGRLLEQDLTICMLAGTLIATPEGPRPIESLKPGERVITANGIESVRFVSITRHHPMPLSWSGGLPIRITAGALGQRLPERDLMLSPDHAVLFEGHLVQASALVNGRTITYTKLEEWIDQPCLVYYNIELNSHTILWAEGLPVESFVDNVPRQVWDNHADYLQLYGSEPVMAEMALPRIKFRRQLPSPLRTALEALMRRAAVQEAEMVGSR